MSKLSRRIADELPSNWRLATLRDVASLGSGTTPSRSRHEDFFNDGTVPWVKTGDLTNGRVGNVEERITERAVKECGLKVYPEGTVLLAMYGGFRQIGRTGILAMRAAINQAITAINPDPGVVISPFLLHWLNFRVLDWRRLAGSSRKDPNISKADIASFPIPIAPVKEQYEIADLLQTWDVGIEETTALIRAKRELRKGLNQQLLAGEIRFPGNPEPWTKRHLRDLTQQLSVRDGGQLSTESVKAVNKFKGLIPMKDRVRAASLDRYKRVPPKAFAYNPMRLNIGSIAMSQESEDVLVSPDYVVFKCIDGMLDPDYLNHLRRTHLWHHFVNVAGNGSVRVRIYYKDLAAMPLHLPPIEEQRRIADVLNACDREVALLTAKLDALKEQKKGLMQKLLTGEIRVKEAAA